ncbi:MAG TPA: SDR family NAD(P)-dependent oxidoreductase [Cyclobacteriaceae bacterium]
MDKYYAVVTGASSGIGKAISYELASKKINLVLVALPKTGLSRIVNQISNDYKVDVKSFEIDLTEDNAVYRFHQWCDKNELTINMLINNAGLGTHQEFERTSVSDLETMLKLNNQAVVMLAYYFLPDLKLNQPGNILNVGSLASFMNIPGKAVYAASKSFIYSFSLSLRMELKRYKINVSCLCPGGTVTSPRVLENISKTKFAGKSILQLPDTVAKEAVRQMLLGKRLIIPGWHNKLLYKLWALLPIQLIDIILSFLFFKQEESKPFRSRQSAIAFRAIALA